MQVVDVRQLVKSPKVLVSVLQKIVQAVVFSFIRRPGKFSVHKVVGEFFCSDSYGNKDYRE